MKEKNLKYFNCVKAELAEIHELVRCFHQYILPTQ